MYEELETVLQYITSKIQEHDLIQIHEQLANLYERARSEPSEEVTSNISELKKKIENIQKKLEPRDWDNVRLKIFNKLGAQRVLGESGFKNLIKKMLQFSNDPHGTSQAIKEFSAQITKLKQNAENAMNSLESLFSEKETVKEGWNKIQIVFENNVSMDTFQDMIDQSREWNIILQNFQFLFTKPTEKSKLWRIYKASPTVFVIISPMEQTFAIGSIALVALGIVEKLYSIRTLKLEIKKTEMEKEATDKMIELTEFQEEKKLNNLIDKEVKEIVTRYIPKSDDTTKRNQAKVSTNYIIKKIYNFIVQGGNVNLVDGKVKYKNVEINQNQLNPTYHKLKQLLNENNTPLLLAKFTKEEKNKAQNILKKPFKTNLKAKVIKKSRGRPSKKKNK